MQAGGRRFNSATDSGPWRTVGRKPCSPAGSGLQFGHGLGAVENPGSWSASGPTAMASIRPRTRGRGEPPGRTFGPAFLGDASIRPRTRGRGEPTSIGSIRRPPAGFNSATDSGPWRTRPRWRTPRGVYSASIRPRTRGRGEQLDVLYPGHASHRFNSATDSGPWRTRMRAWLESLPDRLQFGHGLGAVENALEPVRVPRAIG